MIRSLQRGILSGLMIETFNQEEIKKRCEICEKLMPRYKDYFTKEQLQILKFVYHDSKKYNQDGAVCFGLSELSQRIISKKFPHLVDEMIEILATGAIVEEMIPVYLKELENQTLEI